MGPSGCRDSSPPPAAPQGCQSWRSGLYFCSPFPPFHSLRTPVAGRGLSRQRIRPGVSTGSWGPKWAGETWPRSLLILCPPSGSPISPFGCGIPSPPPAAPQGHQSHPTSTSPPPSPPHAPRPTWLLGVPPVPLVVHGPPPVPGRCPSCAEMQFPHAPTPGLFKRLSFLMTGCHAQRGSAAAPGCGFYLS